MQQSDLKTLLKKLFHAKIDAEDYSALKDRMKESTDNEVGSDLQLLWDEQNAIVPMDVDTKYEVLSNIHNKIDADNNTTLRFNIWKYAAIIIIPLLMGVTGYFSLNRSTPYDFTVLADEGQKSQIMLPDGTHVWLNAGSKITYSSDFNGNNRRVQLVGEAFFDVAKNKELQFVVETGYIDVVVYGTEFNISAYPQETYIKVSLLSGSVSLQNSMTDGILAKMTPGQQISVSKRDLTWSAYNCDVETESIWVKNMLKFENATIEEVFTKLEHWYGLKIHIQNPDANIRYGFTLKSESIREMLDLINRITPIAYRIEGEEVNIKYK